MFGIEWKFIIPLGRVCMDIDGDDGKRPAAFPNPLGKLGMRPLVCMYPLLGMFMLGCDSDIGTRMLACCVG